MRPKLPPLRYWRARTRDDRRRGFRSGMLPGLLAGLLAFAVLVPVMFAAGGGVAAWLVSAVAIAVIVGVGGRVELRQARRRQADDGPGREP